MMESDAVYPPVRGTHVGRGITIYALAFGTDGWRLESQRIG